MKTPRLLRGGMQSFAEQRKCMIQRQLAARGIRDIRVLEAMGRVPREEFVPFHLRCEAYDDWPLPIGHGQTISQPYTVALMTEALQLAGPERVLEIGTGSGYGAAVLSTLVKEVHTIERIPELAEQAAKRLARLGYNNITVHAENGTLGLPQSAPFDAIVVTAGADALPEPYARELVEGGRIVIPIGDSTTSQTMYRYTRHGNELKTEDLGRFAFVPLIGEHGWHTE